MDFQRSEGWKEPPKALGKAHIAFCSEMTDLRQLQAQAIFQEFDANPFVPLPAVAHLDALSILCPEAQSPPAPQAVDPLEYIFCEDNLGHICHRR